MNSKRRKNAIQTVRVSSSAMQYKPAAGIHVEVHLVWTPVWTHVDILKQADCGRNKRHGGGVWRAAQIQLCFMCLSPLKRKERRNSIRIYIKNVFLKKYRRIPWIQLLLVTNLDRSCCLMRNDRELNAHDQTFIAAAFQEFFHDCLDILLE